MSKGWEDYLPAPIEVFHGEALAEFHRRRNELGKSADQGLDGIEFSKIIAEFKNKIMAEYGITSDAVPKELVTMDKFVLVPSKPDLYSREFYDLMQVYRHAPIENQDVVKIAFDNIRKFLGGYHEKT